MLRLKWYAARRFGICVTVVFSLLMPLTSCSQNSSDETHSADVVSQSPAVTESAPTPSVTASDGTVFTGSYAGTYKRLYEDVKTPLAKAILKDGTITDAEWEEIKNAYVTCAKDVGVTVTFDGGGSAATLSYGIVSDEQGKAMHDQVYQCSVDTDFYTISQVWDAGYRISHGGASTLQDFVDCLIDHGLAEKGMTVEEYKQIVSDETRDAETFGKYTDPTNPDYDEAKSRQFYACQDGSAS